LNDFRRICAVLVLGGLLQAYADAQAFKCRQVDDSVAFQDHPCPAGTVASSVLEEPRSAPRPAGPATPGGSVTPACLNQIVGTLPACRPIASQVRRQCWRSKMTADCFDVDSFIAKPAPVCRDRAKAIQSQCDVEVANAGRACTLARLDPVCRQQALLLH
jgi:hypothetical protein